MFRKRAELSAEAVASDADVGTHAHTEEIARSFPNATAVFLPRDHFVAAGNPEVFNAAIIDVVTVLRSRRRKCAR